VKTYRKARPVFLPLRNAFLFVPVTLHEFLGVPPWKLGLGFEENQRGNKLGTKKFRNETCWSNCGMRHEVWHKERSKITIWRLSSLSSHGSTNGCQPCSSHKDPSFQIQRWFHTYVFYIVSVILIHILTFQFSTFSTSILSCPKVLDLRLDRYRMSSFL